MVKANNSDSFKVFSNKKDAEKFKKELDVFIKTRQFEVCKYTIKTKNELINVMNLQSNGLNNFEEMQ
tara:strand:- start:47 stop:247 length:201 start_codon:yes stop_codon:yes gene_type:complete